MPGSTRGEREPSSPRPTRTLNRRGFLGAGVAAGVLGALGIPSGASANTPTPDKGTPVPTPAGKTFPTRMAELSATSVALDEERQINDAQKAIDAKRAKQTGQVDGGTPVPDPRDTKIKELEGKLADFEKKLDPTNKDVVVMRRSDMEKVIDGGVEARVKGKEEDLNRKEAELTRREVELAKREAAAAKPQASPISGASPVPGKPDATVPTKPTVAPAKPDGSPTPVSTGGWREAPVVGGVIQGGETVAGGAADLAGGVVDTVNDLSTPVKIGGALLTAAATAVDVTRARRGRWPLTVGNIVAVPAAAARAARGFFRRRPAAAAPAAPAAPTPGAGGRRTP